MFVWCDVPTFQPNTCSNAYHVDSRLCGSLPLDPDAYAHVHHPPRHVASESASSRYLGNFTILCHPKITVVSVTFFPPVSLSLTHSNTHAALVGHRGLRINFLPISNLSHWPQDEVLRLGFEMSSFICICTCTFHPLSVVLFSSFSFSFIFWPFWISQSLWMIRSASKFYRERERGAVAAADKCHLGLILSGALSIRVPHGSSQLSPCPLSLLR